MILKYTHRNLTWIDIENPTREDAIQVMEEYKVHPLVADELLSPTLRPRVDKYENMIYLILHFPTISHKHSDKTEQEVDFIIGKDFLITTHYSVIDQLHDFSKIFEVNSILDKSSLAEHSGFLFYYLIRELYRGVNDDLDDIGETLERIEESIFHGEEVRMVESISYTSRNLLNVKQAIRPHKEVLESFEAAGAQFFGGDFVYYLRDMIGEYFKAYNQAEGHRETLIELRKTNDSLLTTKTNEIMKVLTIMAFVTFPLALFASIFGMNTEYTPILGTPSDFWIIVGIMLSSMIFMFAFFKYKKWF